MSDRKIRFDLGAFRKSEFAELLGQMQPPNLPPAEHLQAEPDLTEADRAAVANRQKVALAFAAGVTFGALFVAWAL